MENLILVPACFLICCNGFIFFLHFKADFIQSKQTKAGVQVITKVKTFNGTKIYKILLQYGHGYSEFFQDVGLCF